jgi:hypothetical protein
MVASEAEGRAEALRRIAACRAARGDGSPTSLAGSLQRPRVDRGDDGSNKAGRMQGRSAICARANRDCLFDSLLAWGGERYI